MMYFNFLKLESSKSQSILSRFHPVIKFLMLILTFVIMYSIDNYYVKLIGILLLLGLLMILTKKIKLILYLILMICLIAFSYSIMLIILHQDHLFVSIIQIMINIAVFIFPFVIYNIISNFDETVYALECFLSPLSIIKVPVNDIVLVLGMTLSFLPLTIIEMDRILFMNSMRGRDFKTASFIVKIKILISVLTPLIYSFIVQANMLTSSIELRGYDSYSKRTSYRKYKIYGDEHFS